jgi:hypothetical protein
MIVSKTDARVRNKVHGDMSLGADAITTLQIGSWRNGVAYIWGFKGCDSLSGSATFAHAKNMYCSFKKYNQL